MLPTMFYVLVKKHVLMLERAVTGANPRTFAKDLLQRLSSQVMMVLAFYISSRQWKHNSEIYSIYSKLYNILALIDMLFLLCI